MVRECFSEEYRQLARECIRHGDWLDALDCAWKAVRLDPGSRDGLELMKQATALWDSPPASSGDPATIGRVRRRKERLDAALSSEPCLGWIVQDGGAGNPLEAREMSEGEPEERGGSASGKLDARRRELDKAAADAKRQRSSELEEEERRLNRLRSEQTGDPTPREPRSQSRYWDDCELSLEHEFHNLGNDYYKIADFEKALECYNKALELRPDLLETYFNRGLSYTRMQRYDKALEDLTKVIELNPNLAEAYYTRGLIHEYRGDFDAAIADYEKALEVDPNYTKARTQIEVARGKKRDQEAAGRSTSSSSREDEDRIADFSRFRERPTFTFAQVGGNQEAKRNLIMIARLIAGHSACREWGSETPRGILLYGPPGTGKTLLAKALAGEVKCPFYCVPSTAFLNQYYGNTERNLRRLWEQASAHPEGAIIFLDEFDSLGTLRSDVRAPRGDDCHNKAVGCLLELMDGMKNSSSRLVVVAATNCPGNIDDAFLRPGRFNYLIEVPAPGALELAEMFLIHLETAEERAERVDFMTAELREAVRADRDRWLAETFAPKAADPFGLARLAQVAAQRGLVGADVYEVIRRCIQERVMAAVEGLDLGPIGIGDLRRNLEDYLLATGRWDGGGDFGDGGVGAPARR